MFLFFKIIFFHIHRPQIKFFFLLIHFINNCSFHFMPDNKFRIFINLRHHDTFFNLFHFFKIFCLFFSNQILIFLLLPKLKIKNYFTNKSLVSLFIPLENSETCGLKVNSDRTFSAFLFLMSSIFCSFFCP
jgi:hypothetical protein